MHNFNIIKKTIEFAGRPLTLETGRIAKQAGGAVLLTYGKTTILVTATGSKEVQEGQDFFPLTVDVIEKMYASGKIPGGFFKREAKPSTKATLTARLIDRAIRPMFPDGFRNAVHVVVTILSYDKKNEPGTVGILGASAALMISDIPFSEPVAGLKVGIIDDEIVINPTVSQIDNSLLDLDLAGSASSIVMIESGAKEIEEEKLMKAVFSGHEAIQELIKLQHDFAKEAAKEKMEYSLDIIPEDILKEIEEKYGETIKENATISGKLERNTAFEKTGEKILEDYQNSLSEDEYQEKEHWLKKAYDYLIKKFVREAILYKHHRVDGRGLDDIRPITCEIDILPIVHGSALFTRGETQSLGTVTLGTESDEQIIDNLEEDTRKGYFLHYNFPPYSVGEVGFMRGPGRRELGHGALAERALLPVMPSKEEFPYTIRIVSDIMESNGSSSMATVCSGTLSLMAAGVPIKKPVAGIANGLIKEGDDYVVLTDIMGLEDHLGDMDFKVTGTRDGITAMQMDIKIKGITKEIMQIALEKAKVARLYILDLIEQTIPEPRKQLAPTAPRIEQMKINPSKIGEIIGQGGKRIKQIVEDTGVDINISDDGVVLIYSPDQEALEKAKQIITDIVTPPELNKIYDGKVKRVESYGAFVTFMNDSKEGLVHISNIHYSHVKNVSDLLKPGDLIKVKFIGSDRGKIQLSMKGIKGNPEPKNTEGSSYREKKSYGKDKPHEKRFNRKDKR